MRGFLGRYIGDRAFYRRVIAVTLPITLQNILTTFVSLLDNIMVGQVGSEQMTGVSIVNQLFFVFNLCVFGAVAGPGIYTAQFRGSGDNEGVKHTFRYKIGITVLIAAIFAVVMILWHDGLISLFIHEGKENLDPAATLAFAKDYMWVMLLGLLPFSIINSYAGTLRECGETLMPMVAGIAAVFVNCGLNYILIFGKLGIPAMGVVGAAVATVIARFVEAGIIIVWTHSHKGKNPFIVGALRSLGVPKKLFFDITKKGVPLLFNEALWSLGMTTMTQCYSKRGLEVVSAFNISSTVSNLFFCAFFAFGNAVAIIVGQSLGAGELERAKDEDRKLLVCSVLTCIVAGTVMIVMAPFIPGIYKTTDAIKSLAASLIIVNAIYMPFNGYLHTAYFTLRCGGKTMITFLFDSAFSWTVSVPLAFILSEFTGLGIIPMFGIVCGADLIKIVVGTVMIKKGLWIQKLVADKKGYT